MKLDRIVLPIRDQQMLISFNSTLLVIDKLKR
jgi:hypothetical protein